MVIPLLPDYKKLNGIAFQPQWVVDWAISEDMYVIICGPYSEFLQKELFRKKVKESIHFEGVCVSEEYKEKAETLLKAIWKESTA